MKKQFLLLILAITASSAGLTGCSNNAQTGAVIGSLVGAGIGKSTGNHRDKRAAIGAVLGGLVGASVGQDQDRREAAARGYATNAAYTNDSTTHSHGGRTHSHPGASAQHSHNNGPVSSGSVQYQTQTTNREVVYVERPYYPVSTSIVLGTGYYHYPRRHYRNRHHYRNNKRHYRNHHRYNRHNRYNRHHNRHHNKRRY